MIDKQKVVITLSERMGYGMSGMVFGYEMHFESVFIMQHIKKYYKQFMNTIRQGSFINFNFYIFSNVASIENVVHFQSLNFVKTNKNMFFGNVASIENVVHFQSLNFVKTNKNIVFGNVASIENV